MLPDFKSKVLCVLVVIMNNILKKMISKISNSVRLRYKTNKDISQYITLLYESLLERKPTQSEIDVWTNSNFTYLQILSYFINSEEYKSNSNAKQLRDVKQMISLSNTYIVGEDQPIDFERVILWYKNIAEELSHKRPKNLFFIDPKNKNIHSNHSQLTIITSLYKGEKYINTFLENVTNQTIFDQSQLFIIDANSPQNEYEIIKKYLENYPNIKYVRLDNTIGIYESWNLAITESVSEFLTNANVDDLHRNDALELKVQCLRDNPMVDVVYSDIYYSFIPNLTFEVVEKGGIKTNLPTANKFNLLNFNSPHNSPMWRRSLHDRVGYFDPTYKSAGDHEFWLRSAFSGATFMKIKDPVVVYYQNPDGMSTQQDSPGNIEGPETVKRYRSLLNL